jgi:competence protein ComEC
MRLFFTPFIPLTIVLIAGIILGDACCGFMSVWGWLVLFVLSLGVFFVCRNLLVKSGVLLLCCCLLGSLVYSVNERCSRVALPKEKVRYDAVVMSRPVDGDKTVHFDAVITEINGKPLSRNIHTKVTLQKDAYDRFVLRLGDGFEAYSLLQSPRNRNSNFDNVRWMRVHGFHSTTFIAHSDIRSKYVREKLSVGESIRLKAMKVRQELLDGMSREVTDYNSLSLLAAMTLGDKSMLDRHTKEVFSQSGGTHVLALSGLHMSIIFALLLLLFRGNLVGKVLSITSLWLFVILVGMPSSAIRAATMLSIYALADIINKHRTDSFHTLTLAAFVILLASPMSLWDVGFQMSFIAIVSIFVFFKPLYRKFKFRFMPLRWLYASVCLSVAAQIGTAPLVAYYFGRFSCYFILTNIFVVPCTTAILYLMLMAFMLLPIKSVSVFMIHAAAFVAMLMYEVVNWIANLPGASIEGIHLNTVQLVAIYVMIVAIYLVKLNLMLNPKS